MHLGMATYNAQNPSGQNGYSVLNQKSMLLYVYYDIFNNKEHMIMKLYIRTCLFGYLSI